MPRKNAFAFRPALLAALLAVLPTALAAQQPGGVPEPSTAGRPQPSTTGAPAPQAHAELLLALPFDNTGTSSSVDWIGDAFPEILNQRFTSAGFLPISRADRVYALEHLGLPEDFRPTRASTLRLAQTLDADAVVFGSYQVDGDQIVATARVLDIANLRESKPITESAALSRLPDLINAIAWRVTRQLDPRYNVAEQTFVAEGSNLRLDAFEAYARGLGGAAPADRVRHLLEAVRLDPSYGPAWLALGDAEFASQKYDQAAVAYGHLNRNDSNALQADFHRGLAFFYTGKYLPAEDAFAFVSTRLPLPDVLNDEGVAAARRGKDAAPLFQQALAGDPKDADFHFNLALAYARRGDAANAQKEADTALQLRPGDTEIAEFSRNLKTPGFVPAARPAGSVAADAAGADEAETQKLPLERIKRTYNEAAFRQAAFELEQLEAVRAATEPPAKRVVALLAEANRYANAGLLLESEREDNRALALDPNSAEAYVGLAKIRERTADRDAARKLAMRSLAMKDNAAAHLVLARLALVGNQLPMAASEVEAALRLDRNNAEARGLQQAVAARGGQVP